jgi:hypothetical protein
MRANMPKLLKGAKNEKVIIHSHSNNGHASMKYVETKIGYEDDPRFNLTTHWPPWHSDTLTALILHESFPYRNTYLGVAVSHNRTG